MMTIAMTQAKIGRSMKKRDSTMSALSAAPVRRRGLDPSAIGGCGVDFAPAAPRWPGLTFCRPSTITRRRREAAVTSHSLPRRVRARRRARPPCCPSPTTSTVASPRWLRVTPRCGTSSASRSSPCVELRAHEHARQQLAARIREHRAQHHGAGARDRPSLRRTAACRARGYSLPSSRVSLTSAWFCSSLCNSPSVSCRCSRSSSMLDCVMST